MARAGELTIGRASGPSGSWRPILIALGLTSLAHAAGLVLVQAGPTQIGGRVGQVAPALQVRSIEIVPAAIAAPVAPPSPRTAREVLDAPGLERKTATAPTPSPEVTAPVTESTPASPALSAPRDGLMLDYIPRSLLTTPPVATTAIEIIFPEEVNNDVHLTAELSLFIDETGLVQQVRVDSAPLPPVMEDAARTAFLRARFSPGEVQGQPVRSVIRVEVSFDAERRPATSP